VGRVALIWLVILVRWLYGAAWVGRVSTRAARAVTFSGMVTSDDQKYGPSRSARSLGLRGDTRPDAIS
jgi:hypothetical protein